MGKKYIVEIGRLERLYKASVNGNGKPNITWLSPEVDLTPYTEPDLEQVREEAYQKGYETGYEDGYNEPGKNQQEAYQRGLNDAWEAASEIAIIPYDEVEKIFGATGWHIFMKCTASEVIEKIKAREEKKQEEIKVGDEVDWMGDKYVVTYVRNEAKKADMISCKFGSACENVAFSALGKTGRHFPEIAEVLEKMRGEQDG